MKHYTQFIRHFVFGSSLCAALTMCGALSSVSAQTQTQTEDQTPKVESKTSKASSVNRGTGGRDPFTIYKVQPKKVRKNVPLPIEPPPIQARIERYKSQKQVAMSMQQPAPKPTTALLLSEMQVIGIFRTPRGYAAMVEATPIKLSYTIYPGEKLFDGQLVAIEEDRLIFRRETRWTDGRVMKSVETKPLRQVNPVADPLANTKASSAASAPAAESRPAAPEK